MCVRLCQWLHKIGADHEKMFDKDLHIDHSNALCELNWSKLARQIPQNYLVKCSFAYRRRFVYCFVCVQVVLISFGYFTLLTIIAKVTRNNKSRHLTVSSIQKHNNNKKKGPEKSVVSILYRFHGKHGVWSFEARSLHYCTPRKLSFEHNPFRSICVDLW